TDLPPQVLQELAAAWNRLGDPSMAQQTWTRIARENPNDLECRKVLLDLALAHLQWDAARQILAEVQTLEKGKGKAWRSGTIALALQEARQGKPEKLAEARQHLQLLKAQDPSGAAPALLEGNLEELAGNQTLALKQYKT